MRRLHEWMIVIMLLGPVLGSCSGTGGEAAPSTEAAFVESSRAPVSGVFAPERPTEEEGARYLLYANVILTDTPWTIDEMGQDAWGRLMIDGAVGVCRSYHDGATTRQAMESALATSPYGAGVPGADDVDAYDLLSAFLIGGVDAFCPELVADIYGSVFSIPLDAAWEDMTGGPAPERPIRLP